MAQPVLFPDGKFYNVEGVEPEVIKILYEKLSKEQAEQVIDDVANIDIDATELRNAFNGVKEHLPLIQNLNDKVESLEHEVSALQEQLS